MRKEPRDVENAFVNYFGSMFTSDYGGGSAINLHGIEGKVTADMNPALVKEFTRDEISAALHQMSPLKAPGLDGLLAGFFQDSWDTVGEEVCQAVLYSLNFGFINNDLNFTYIALILKIANPSSVSEFRPISLCNVIYKI